MTTTEMDTIFCSELAEISAELASYDTHSVAPTCTCLLGTWAVVSKCGWDTILMAESPCRQLMFSFTIDVESMYISWSLIHETSQ